MELMLVSIFLQEFPLTSVGRGEVVSATGEEVTASRSKELVGEILMLCPILIQIFRLYSKSRSTELDVEPYTNLNVQQTIFPIYVKGAGGGNLDVEPNTNLDLQTIFQIQVNGTGRGKHLDIQTLIQIFRSRSKELVKKRRFLSKICVQYLPHQLLAISTVICQHQTFSYHIYTARPYNWSEFLCLKVPVKSHSQQQSSRYV